jgi:phytol kinase
MTRADLLAVAAVIGAAIVMLALLGVCRRFLTGSEGLRKIAHLGTGALALPFPWIFSSLRPVMMVCGLALVLLAVVAKIPSVRARLGGSLYCVGRDSHGEFYFPIAVAILFALARGDKLLYSIPILVLTFADAVAAVLGERYGTVAYEGIGGNKSLEGSVAFFTVAFFAVHVPLLLFTDLTRAQTLLVAMDIALVVMLLEAVSWRGLDNVVIPLGVFLLLHIYTALPVPQLIYRFVGALVLIAFVLLYRSRTTLQHTALLASALVLYASWSIGGWRWLVAPALLFLSYSFFVPRVFLANTRKDNVLAVASVASAGFLWLYLAHVREERELLFPYTAAYTVHLAILGWTLHVLRDPALGAWKRGMVLLVQCWLVMFVPYVLIGGFSRVVLSQAALALPLCAASFALFCMIEPRHDGLYSVGAWRWAREAAVVLVTTLPLALVGGMP